jgi:hypothetical protein
MLLLAVLWLWVAALVVQPLVLLRGQAEVLVAVELHLLHLLGVVEHLVKVTQGAQEITHQIMFLVEAAALEPLVQMQFLAANLEMVAQVLLLLFRAQ